MTTSKFLRQLKVLNPRLRVMCFEGSQKLAGLYMIDDAGEYFDICGVDKDYVPEYTEWDSAGHIVKSGWRRVFAILMQLGITTPRQVTKVCPGYFLHWSQYQVDVDRGVRVGLDPIADKIAKYSEQAPVQAWKDPDSGKIESGTVLTAEQNLEIAADIEKKESHYKLEETEKERWFLKTWQHRGGNISDKPSI